MKDSMRKIRIFIIGLLSIVAVFLVYLLLFRSPLIRIDTEGTGEDIEVRRVGENAPTFGDTKIGGAEVTEFRQVDKATGEVKRVFGFEKLLNPRQRGPHMDLLRPYMHLYQGRYKYEIRSDTGMVEVEEAAGTLAPKSARLTQNVTIYIKDKTDPDTILGTIYMEHLDYESERSQFSTTGPIEMFSDQAQLTGKGMVLIYNEPGNRLEYLEIPEIDRILLKNVSDPGGSGSSPQDENETQAAGTSPVREETPGGQTVAEAEPAAEKAEKVYYECELAEDVRIEYGPDIIINADEKLTLRNILFGDSSPGASESPAQDAPNENNAGSDTAQPQNPSDNKTNEESQAEETLEVIVTCRGAMTIEPMTTAGSSLAPPQRLLELFGAPVRVQQIVSARQGETIQEIAQCARLAYNMDSEIMSMFTDSRHEQIRLKLDQERSGLVTSGHLQWYRSSNSAKIFGPGKLLRYREKNAPSEANIESEMDFQGVMDLLFAESQGAKAGQTFELQKAQFAGGFQARVNRDNPAYMSAGFADFIFKNENQLERANLRRDVNFTSQKAGQSAATATAHKADLYFTGDNRIARADLDGDVHFISTEPGESPSSMRSEKANLLFKDDNQLRQADMSGSVRLTSTDGNLHTENAQVLFAMNPATGTSRPIMFHANAPSVLETAPSRKTDRKTRLKARQIDYDLITGNAVAAGPVEFSFYPEPTPGSEQGSSDVPIVIHATQNAKFYSRRDRAEFHGDVVAERKDIRPEYTQTDICKGDTLLVNLGPSQGLKDVSMRGQKVFFDSIRKKLSLTLSHIRLKCTQLDYDEMTRIILAHGPGSIEVNNENVQVKPDREQAERFSLNSPCFARIDGFDLLEWKIDENLLDARARDKSIHIGYWPIEDGEMGQIVHASSTHVIAEFYQTPEGRNELEKFRAFDGVEYREEDGNELIGDVLVYTPAKQLITVDGTGNSPCLVNGSRVDRIRYHLDTGKISSEISTTPGALPAP